MPKTFVYFDAASADGTVTLAPCLNPDCEGYGQEQEYRSDACPKCGVLG